MFQQKEKTFSLLSHPTLRGAKREDNMTYITPTSRFTVLEKTVLKFDGRLGKSGACGTDLFPDEAEFIAVYKDTERIFLNHSNKTNIRGVFDIENWHHRQALKKAKEYINELTFIDDVLYVMTGRLNAIPEVYKFMHQDGQIIKISPNFVFENGHKFIMYASFKEACAWYDRHRGTVEYACPTEYEVQNHFDKELIKYFENPDKTPSKRVLKYINKDFICL